VLARLRGRGQGICVIGAANRPIVIVMLFHAFWQQTQVNNCVRRAAFGYLCEGLEAIHDHDANIAGAARAIASKLCSSCEREPNLQQQRFSTRPTCDPNRSSVSSASNVWQPPASATFRS